MSFEFLGGSPTGLFSQNGNCLAEGSPSPEEEATQMGESRVLLQYFFAARLRSWLGNILITTFRKLSLTSRKAEIPEYSPPALSNSRGIIERKRRLSSVVGTKAAL